MPVLGGCSQVSHVDELMALKAVADEQDQIGRQVKAQDRKFDLMVAEARAGTLESYTDKTKIVRAFGEPIFIRPASGEGGGEELESWLYRHATEYFKADKIYLYFDTDGNLVRSEYLEAQDGEVR